MKDEIGGYIRNQRDKRVRPIYKPIVITSMMI